MLTELEIREAFHCVLLAHLPADYRAPVGGEAPLRLKGGVNLRLFHGSPRYSEDIDFDLSPVRGPRFVEHLRRLLLNPGPFKRHLLGLGIQGLDVSEFDGGDGGFKQKLRVIVGGVGHHTKVEVSYGEETAPAEARISAIPDSFAKRYRLPPNTMIAAYPDRTALWQKVLALSRRTHPQTRDVFDIHHLRRADRGEVLNAAVDLIRARMKPDQVESAANATIEFTALQFQGQTAAYLPDGIRNDAIAEWPGVQQEVWTWLAELSEEMRNRGGE
jgi:predicted nucleotidyltransferase component of viral defense system